MHEASGAGDIAIRLFFQQAIGNIRLAGDHPMVAVFQVEIPEMIRTPCKFVIEHNDWI